MASPQPAAEAPPEEPKRPTQLKLMKIDGLTVEKAYLNISGRIELDLSVAQDVALMEDLKLGNGVRLEVDAWVMDTAGKAPRNKEGEVKEVRKNLAVKIHSVNNTEYMVVSKP